MTHRRLRRRLLYAVLLIFFAAAFSCHADDLRKRRGMSNIAWAKLRGQIKRQYSLFPGTAGIVIKDLASGKKISLNDALKLPAASLIKIPIMAACFQASEEGRLSLSQEIRLRPGDKTPGSGVLKTMANGSSLTVERLIELMIVESDNTAANILISRLTPDYLNAFFLRQGLKNTRLRRRMMDFSKRKQGVENYTSAQDIALILERMYEGSCVNARVSARCMAVLLKQKLKDRIPKRLPRDTPVAHKTGLERNICHDAGIVFTSGGDFLICVLTKHVSKKGGYRFMKDFIAQAAFTVYRTYQAAAETPEAGPRNAGGYRSTQRVKGG